MEENNSNISQEELAKSNEIVQRLWNYYGNKNSWTKKLRNVNNDSNDSKMDMYY